MGSPAAIRCERYQLQGDMAGGTRAGSHHQQTAKQQLPSLSNPALLSILAAVREATPLRPAHLPHQGSILEAVSAWEGMAPPTHGHLLMDSLAVLLLLLSVPGCSHPPTLQPHRDSPGEIMTPSSCEIQLCINWLPWENTVQYQLVPLQREQEELHLWSGASHAHSTLHTGAPEPQPSLVPQGPSRRSMVAARQADLAGKEHDFPVLPLEHLHR